MGEAEGSRCPGCGLALPAIDGPTHAYIGASAACWARFGEVLAREFQDPDWFRPHQITVDRRMAHRPEYTWLEPPAMAGRMNVLDVLAAREPDEHRRLVHAWGADVWDAWREHHATIWRWLDVALG